MTKYLTLFVFLAIIACKKPDTYSITITAQTGGNVSTSGGTYEEGEVLRITATPAADYQFVRWSDGSTSNPYVLNVHQNITLEAQFEKITYALTVAIEGQGVVEQRHVGSGKSTDYEAGSQVELQANPAEHWHFSHWSGLVSSTQNPIEVIMDKSMALTAVFVKSKYALTVDIVGEGTVLETLISTADKTDYESGSRVELIAQPDEHWAFAGWSGAVSSTDNPIDIEMTGALTVTATFIPLQHSLAVGIDGQGRVEETLLSASAKTDYLGGSRVRLTAQPDEHWAFAGWSGAVSSTDNPIDIEMTGALTVTATFIPLQHSLEVGIDGQGRVEETLLSASAKTDYLGGSLVRLTAQPDDHWAFAGWSGAVSSTDNPIDIEMTGAKTVTATFVPLQYSLELGIDGQGRVEETLLTSSAKTDYLGGSQVRLTAQPDDHWAFAGWSGAVSSTVNPIDIEMTGAKTVTATFIRNQYALDIGIDGQGTVNQTVVSASRSTDFPSETVVQLVAQPATGSIFYAWSGDVTATDDQIDLVMDKSKQVTATFEVQATTLLDNNNIFIGVGKWRIRRPRTFFRNSNNYVLEEVVFTSGGTFRLQTSTSSVTGDYRVDSASKVTLWQSQNLFATLDDLVLSKSFIGFNYQANAGCSQEIKGDKDTTYVEPESDFKVTASQTAFQFGHEAATGQVLFNTANISVHSEATWINLASSNQQLDFDLTENSSTSNREAVINVYYGTITDTPAVVISIKQNGKPVTNKITLASNGVTIVCPEAPIGHKEVVNGKEYEVVDLTILKAKIANNEAVDCVCTSQITNMNSLFKGKATFNQDISSWDVSKVTDMTDMFNEARNFNQAIGAWDVSSVTDMQWMFFSAVQFNQELSSWDVSNVGNTSGMFSKTPFNIDISSWDVSKVFDMAYMFHDNNQFNQNIGRWDVSSVIDMKNMFDAATAFDQNLSGWCVRKITTPPNAFADNSSLSSTDLPKWGTCPADTSEATNKITLASNGVTIVCPAAPIGHKEVVNGKEYEVVDLTILKAKIANNEAVDCVCTSQITSMASLFVNNSTFNQDISSWDTGQVTTFEKMFQNAISFNGQLNNWDTAKVTNMAMLFNGATLFNQPIGSWDTGQVTTMEGVFFAARTFNQPLANWDVRKVQNFDQMFRLAASFNQPLNTWKTDQSISMSYMFSETHAFNRSLNSWNTAGVLRMDYMFLKATSFNGDISSWNVSKVSTMKGMFQDAGLFNQNIQNWNVSGATYMEYMFYNAYNFSQSLMGWCVDKVTTAPSNFTHVGSIFQEAQHPIWVRAPQEIDQ